MTYYEILGVPTQATAEELNAAYQEKSKAYAATPEAPEAKELAKAFAVLTDEAQRKEYDAGLAAPAAEAEPAAKADAPAASPAPAAPKPKMDAKKKRNLIGAVIAAVAIIVLLAAVILDGRSKAKQDEAEQTPPAETAAPAETDSATLPAAPALDYDAAYAKYAPDTLVYTMGDEQVTWGEYYCWIYSVLGQLSSYYGITDWNTQLDATLTVEDYVRDYAEGMSSQHKIINAKARELGISLSEADQEAVAAMVQEDADTYHGGDMSALLAYLDDNYFTEDYYRYMSATPLLYNKLFAHFYGEDAETLSEEDAINYLNEQGYLHAKHILLKTVDDSNAPLDDAAKAEKLTQAEALLAELQACPAEELAAKFDELIAANGEDPGQQTYTDGYYFQTGEMVPAFETAASELADGELSGIVESDYGYHILYRPAIHADDLFAYDSDNQAVTVRRAAANGLFSAMMADWAGSMEVVYAPEFEALKLDALFDVA